jgi:RimJ/RimL family protein N-acetyltransferase
VSGRTETTLRFDEIRQSDAEDLTTWISSQTWPYHARPRVDADWFRSNSLKDFFDSSSRSFWVIAPDSMRVGIIRVFDLLDVTPLVDLRIVEARRGQRIGTVALGWITRFVFDTHAETPRLAGYTRHDNWAMRRVFEKCGFAKEAYHRQSWRVEGSALADSVGYAILRCDWVAGTTTPVPWA